MNFLNFHLVDIIRSKVIDGDTIRQRILSGDTIPL